MSTVKPDIAPEQVVAFLQDHFGKPVSELTPITEGLIARTFSFCMDDQDYIVRLLGANMLAYYEKEKYIGEHYASPRLVIPPIVHFGQSESFHYAISHRVSGRTLSRLSTAEYRQALPSVIETLGAIHQVDVSSTSGYGLLDGMGNGTAPSWRSSLSMIREEDPEWDFYGKWHVLFETTFLERDLFDKVYGRMVRLLEFCPDERYLIHGGYGFQNVLVHDAQVTGVVGWMDARYGDFVYDIAWLDYFSPQHNHAQLYSEYYMRRGLSIPNLKERLLCYMSYNALDGMRFFAKTNDASGYQWTRQRILRLLSDAG